MSKQTQRHWDGGDAVRRRLHPEGVVSYIIDRNINTFGTESDLP